MIYTLPTTIELSGVDYEIRSDYRAALDICAALDDIDLSDDEKLIVALDIFYKDFGTMPTEDYKEAIEKCFWFINCGQESPKTNGPKLVDWDQDFPFIVAPINRILGAEIRSIEYMHWWTFISYYNEIGTDCTFSQIVQIRSKLATGKKLEKSEREWYSKNRHLVDFKKKYTKAEDEAIKQWTT